MFQGSIRVRIKTLKPCNSESFELLHYLDHMRHLRHHAADGVRVRTLNHLIQPREPQTLDHQLLFHRGTNRGPHPLQVNLPACRTSFLRRHLVNLENSHLSEYCAPSTEYCL